MATELLPKWLVTDLVVYASQPDITIETPFEIWLDIMTGRANGM